MAGNNQEPKIQTIVETENYSIWRAEEPDGETTYNLQLNNVTVNFFEEEWAEFLDLVRELVKEGKR
jgi:protein-tyrosine phosphatase